ncbi:MAG: TonB-dependent receptor [Proteobacteria bacterium]|nr:TonB-dependent receptor [Pseudomonadota bacterium]
MYKKAKSLYILISASAAFLAATGFAPAAQAQEGADEAIEEIITTGTRRSQRSASDSSVPIDVISGEEFENVGSADLMEMLKAVIPSYNVDRQSISDAATLVRPATMRGLPPDNVLIMVNGKRRHRSGVIAELGGSLAEGSQGADISAIPALAIKQAEILRDGAAAQYGSDAIAGVMNFILKDASDGMTLEARTGEFMEGDGTLVQFMGNVGLPLGDDGFINVTGTWSQQDPTSRSTQRTDAITLIAAGNTDVRQPFAQIWGGPEYRDNWNIFVNSGIQLNDSQEIYAFGNFGRRETEGGFFFRNPNSRSAVFTHDQGGETVDLPGDDNDVSVSRTYRAIVDTNIGPGVIGVVSNCPALVSPGDGGDGDPLDAGDVADDVAAMAALPANCWLLNQLLPGGYTPQFGGDLIDASIVGGVRGELDNGLLYDFSASYGRNKVSFFLNNTWNPSNGPNGIIDGQLQRDFDIGSYVQSENNLNVDFVLPIAVDGLASDLSFAFGGEYRDEVFETIIGEGAAWNAGDYAFQNVDGSNCYEDPANPGTCDVIRDSNGVPILFDDDEDGIGESTHIVQLPNLSIGSHGFAGFSPPQAGIWGRSNIAVYAELEADVTDRFTAAVSVRYEDFESFGDTTNFKTAMRFAVTDTFAVRGSFNTGFRAPTPGQENVTKVSTRTVQGELQQSGQIPPTNPIALVLGALPLTPEESTNFSVGIVWDISDNFNLTADYFQINLEDRISSTGLIEIDTFQANDPAYNDVNCPITKLADGTLSQCLQELGVPGAADLSSISFYTNDFETTTTGIDLIATWDADWGNAGNGSLVAAWNWTETEVDNAGSEVSRNKVVDLENFNPRNRGVFTYNHFINDFRFMVRARYYDDWVEADFGDDLTPRGPNGTGYTFSCAPNEDACYSGETIFDLEAAYTFNEKYSVIVGVQNVLDEAGPLLNDNLDGTVGSGNTYPDSTPWGYEGGFWYARFRAEFD